MCENDNFQKFDNSSFYLTKFNVIHKPTLFFIH